MNPGIFGNPMEIPSLAEFTEQTLDRMAELQEGVTLGMNGPDSEDEDDD